MPRICSDCMHKDVCELYDIVGDPRHAIGCGRFKDSNEVAPKRETVRELLTKLDNLLDQTEGHTRGIHSTTYNVVKSFIRDRMNEYEVNLYKDNQSNKE